MLLFNKTIKPLNQLAKKKIQKKTVFGATPAGDFLYLFFLLDARFYESYLYAKYQKKEKPILDSFNSQ